MQLAMAPPEQQHQQLPSLLLVGAPGAGKHALIAALQPDVSSTKDHAAGYRLQLDTKYYSAAARVQVASPSSSCCAAAAAAEALLLVFDASSVASFRQLQSWVAAHADDLEGAGVRLAVANKADLLCCGSGEVARQDWHEEAMAWCGEHLIEYVEAAAACADVDAQLRLDGEVQGVARVREALEAHMWPGLVEKPWPRSGVHGGSCSTGAAEAGGAAGASGSQHEAAAGAPAADDGEAPKPACSSGSNGLAQVHESRAQAAADSGSVPAEESSADTSGSPSVGPSEQRSEQPPAQQERQKSSNKSSRCEQELEAGLDNFDAVLGQLSGARERLSKLPDAERRAAAADMALRFAAMLGVDDDDDTEGADQ